MTTRRMTELGISCAVLVVALVLVGLALADAPQRELGVFGMLLLGVALVALGVFLVRQRERLHETRADLARARLRAEATIEASPDGIAVLEGRRIYSANPAFRNQLGVGPDERLAGRHVEDLVVEDDREMLRRFVVQRLAGAVEPDHIDVRVRRKSGAEVLLEAAAARIPGPRTPQLALFVRDTSQRRLVESRLRHVARVEALTDVAESVAGEFEKVLSGIRREAREGQVHEDAAARIETIERLSSRGLALVRRVRTLAPSAFDDDEKRPFELVRLVRDASADFMRTLPSRLSLRVLEEGPPRLIVSGDAAVLREALWQVLQNAAEAQREGEILVRTRAREIDETKAKQHPGVAPGHYALVEVRDTGPGMESEVRHRAFEPFFSTKGQRASGLGLTLAVGAVRGHGGLVELDSVEGRGTIVRFSLPLLPDDALPESFEAEASVDPLRVWRGRETVLVIDDDLAHREAARDVLEAFGYHVEGADSARDGFSRLRQKPAVDLVLLDMVLPGWSGLEVLRRILRIWPGQRVIMVSPYPLPDQEAQALGLGAAETTRRPFESPDLARLVRRTLDRAAPAPALDEE